MNEIYLRNHRSYRDKHTKKIDATGASVVSENDHIIAMNDKITADEVLLNDCFRS